MQNYYNILNVSPDSEHEVILAAYKALMKKYHPDTNNSPQAAKRAQQINEAFETLSDPMRRKDYDEKLNVAAPKQAGPSKRRGNGTTQQTQTNKKRHPASKTKVQPMTAKKQPFHKKHAGILITGGGIFFFFVLPALLTAWTNYREKAAEQEQAAAADEREKTFIARAQECVKEVDAESQYSEERVFHSAYSTFSYKGEEAESFQKGDFEVLDAEKTKRAINQYGQIRWSPTIRNDTSKTIQRLWADFIIVDVAANKECRILWNQTAYADNIQLAPNRVKKVNIKASRDSKLEDLPTKPEEGMRFVMSGVFEL